MGWGTRTLGELGINAARGEKDTTLKPLQIGTDSDWNDIATGDFHRLALKKDGTLWIWGTSLGLGEDKRIFTPAQIGNDNDWVKINAGLYMSVAIKNDGTAWMWGENKNDQLGLKTSLDIVVQPT